MVKILVKIDRKRDLSELVPNPLLKLLRTRFFLFLLVFICYDEFLFGFQDRTKMTSKGHNTQPNLTLICGT